MVEEAASLGRTLYVVRHAEREDNINNRWFQKYPDHQSDNTPLSDRGRSQAEDLKEL
jgi:broad specificity phosphatase PhoE